MSALEQVSYEALARRFGTAVTDYLVRMCKVGAVSGEPAIRFKGLASTRASGTPANDQPS